MIKEQDDFKQQRRQMIREQLMQRGISDEKVLDAFNEVPRHKFIPDGSINNAYGDYPVSIGEGQTVSQPYIVALMTQCLNPKKTDKVLEIGTGSGYQTALLAELAHSVYSVERVTSLSERAKGVLEEIGYKNIKLKIGDGTLGWEDYAPYDGIIVTCAAPGIPEPLRLQLKENGRLVIPVGGSFSQDLILATKQKDTLKEETICGCTFVPLIGKYGWSKSS